MDDPSALLIWTNFPDRSSAESLARALLQRQLAACINIMPGVHSLYRWRGAIEQATEVTVLIKSVRIRYAELEQAIRAMHPYEVPEIIAVPICAGLPAYLDWLAHETTRIEDAAK
ncbi:MAG TPA: divalent-cation tolerance protein CutA [Oxalicibacterium sp.]|jgi:periplasmic divalent cation tolerance protein|nr:divalent-cation tolerance protein CutA [Oxalicibacterium sp.]